MAQFEIMARADLLSGIGPNYRPFVAQLEELAAQSDGMARAALVAVQFEGFALYGAALVKAGGYDDAKFTRLQARLQAGIQDR